MKHIFFQNFGKVNTNTKLNSIFIKLFHACAEFYNSNCFANLILKSDFLLHFYSAYHYPEVTTDNSFSSLF